MDSIVCSGIYSQRDHDEALARVLASGRPLCKASGTTRFVGQCVRPPEAGGWCHMHRYAAGRATP